MKLLHSADWHLDSPLAEDAGLRSHLLQIPGAVADLAIREQCDLVLLSGDLFDGPASPQSVAALRRALESLSVPVFISPGNHDCLTQGPWQTEAWPENVHIFTSETPQSVALPRLNCRVWGAAFRAGEAKPLLQDFRAEGDERYAVGVFHGDPTQANSAYNPVTRSQVRESGLDYLALGHIHKGDSFRAGDTLCAWPGCAMGRGFDETGEKGVLIVTLAESAEARFVPLPLPRFYWLQATKQDLAAQLPAAPTGDHYRVDLTGEWDSPDLEALKRQFAHIPHLQLRDHTVMPIDLWQNAGADSLEGVYFALLRDSDALPSVREQAARISRQLLSGQEVTL